MGKCIRSDATNPETLLSSWAKNRRPTNQCANEKPKRKSETKWVREQNAAVTVCDFGSTQWTYATLLAGDPHPPLSNETFSQNPRVPRTKLDQAKPEPPTSPPVKKKLVAVFIYFPY